MVEITTFRIWISASIAWPLFWLLVFDRWFANKSTGINNYIWDTSCRLGLLVEILPAEKIRNFLFSDKFSLDKCAGFINNLKT